MHKLDTSGLAADRHQIPAGEEGRCREAAEAEPQAGDSWPKAGNCQEVRQWPGTRKGHREQARMDVAEEWVLTR